MPLFKVVLMIVWLSNANGSIVAQASGVAVDVPACERLAVEKIAYESGNPDLGGSTATFSCWNTSTRIQAREQVVPGSVDL
jgi:hypothetical protein